MQYVLLDEFLLSLAQVELLHLLHQHLPSYRGYFGCTPTFLLLFLLILELLILPLDVSFCILCSLLGSLGHHLLLLLLCLILLDLRCLCCVCSSSLTDCLLSHSQLLLYGLIGILCGCRLLQYL